MPFVSQRTRKPLMHLQELQFGLKILCKVPFGN